MIITSADLFRTLQIPSMTIAAVLHDQDGNVESSIEALLSICSPSQSRETVGGKYGNVKGGLRMFFCSQCMPAQQFQVARTCFQFM